VVEQIWVTVSEGADKTGYSRFRIRELARKNWSLPESERLIKLRRHTNGYMVWLPDLFEYKEKYGHGPQPQRQGPKSIA